MIIVDYVDGAGGEYMSYFLDSHKELSNYAPDQHNMQLPARYKILNTTSLMNSNWDEDFANEYCKIKNDIKVVSYHLYKFPHHIDIIRNIDPAVRFVKIDSNSNDKLIKYDFLRKVYLKKFTNKDLHEIKILINTYDNNKKITVLQKLKMGDLYHIDLELIRRNKVVNRKNRLDAIYDFVDKKITPPTTDIIISYTDFFIDFARTPDAYQTLCNQLNIDYDSTKLQLLLERNKQNHADVVKFMDNFEKQIEKL
jgi:hypothetical protein